MIKEKHDLDNLIIITHKKNKGLGAAIKTGMNKAIEIKEIEFILTKDADMTQDIEIIGKMVELLDKGDYDVVIASRYLESGSQKCLSFRRKLVALIGSKLCRYVIGYRSITDYTTNFRAYRKTIIDKLYKIYGGDFIIENDFSSTVELIFKILNFRPSICEVPLSINYGNKLGKSKMNITKNSFKVLKIICEYLFNSGKFKSIV